ncbi:MAG: phospho-N-acetylmuramoyl-pentapeptide-transferase [Candidatus Aminicenantes bacterium]|nr:phospho-N-acetylmuramoyl-pentapeptide-transferase [Candidatus Aminicenantes bacterium]
MLYWLLVPMKQYFIFFNVFRYITVRTALAGITALLISMVLGHWVIKGLKKHQVGEEIRPDGPKSHSEKRGTPSMGGILIIAATLIPTLLWGDLENIYVWIAVFTMLSFGILGFWDDYLKIKKKKVSGLIIRKKLIIQIFLAGVIGLFLLYLGSKGEFDLRMSLPFFKAWTPYLGVLYLPWIMFILVGSSNAVNFADGLDGLAIGLTLISATALTALCYIAGHALWSQYLNITRVGLASELTVFLGAMAGACLGFLWYNCHPAEVFMGDTGALSLGGTIGAVAILIKQEFLLFTVAGVFILEALSVLIQISYFKMTGGKRIFRMAPLHHHFELMGWSEQKIVVRFWIVGIIFALFSLTTLKLR